MGTVTVGTDTTGSCTLGSVKVGVGMEAAAARAGRGSPIDRVARAMHSAIHSAMHRAMHRAVHRVKYWVSALRQGAGRGMGQGLKMWGAEKEIPPGSSPRTVVMVTLRGLFLHVAEPVGAAMVWRLSRRIEFSVCSLCFLPCFFCPTCFGRSVLAASCCARARYSGPSKVKVT